MNSTSTEAPPHRVLTMAEDELSRIVLDIHDGPVQYLFTALSLLTGIQQEVAAQPDLVARLAQVGMLLESSLYEIKSFMGAFRPPEFRRRSLVSIVEGLVIQHEEWTNNTVELEIDHVPEGVTLPVKIALYRILQEALSNSYRHAGVEKHWVRLWGEGDRIYLEVWDEGRGFTPPDLEQPPNGDHATHIGLRGMYDRVALLGGTLRLISQPGAGACVRVETPAYV